MEEKRAGGSVAVVIPCFDDGATLAEAVASAQGQDVPGETIVVDDGLRRLRDVLDSRPEAAAAWGSIQSFGDLDHLHRSRPMLDPWQVSYQNHLPICSLYRRTALLEAGGWQLPGGYEDWDLWMSLAERGCKGIAIPEVTAHYRVQSGRRLSRSSQRHAERIERLRARGAEIGAPPPRRGCSSSRCRRSTRSRSARHASVS